MSFASETRAEIARTMCTEDCCARAELAAALLASGGISVRFGTCLSYSLSVTTSAAVIVRHYFQLLKRRFGVTADILTLKSNSLKGVTRYRLDIPAEDAQRLLKEIGLSDPDALFGVRSVPTDEITSRSCCRRAFIRSAFMIGGTLPNPEVEFHAEIAAPDEDFAQFTADLLKDFEIHAKVTNRGGRYSTYLKKGSEITDLLSLMGASNAVMKMNSVIVNNSISNRVLRQRNFDTANITRAADTAVRQIEDIRLIESTIGLDRLPPALREVAELRLGMGSISLADLGEALSKPLTKAGVNARLMKIRRIADRLRAGEDAGL